MTKEVLIETITRLLNEYIENATSFDSNPQLRINPTTNAVTIVNGKDMLAEIEGSNEAIEEAASAEGAANEDSTDYQVKRNPDFYAVSSLLKTNNDGKRIPDLGAIKSIMA